MSRDWVFRGSALPISTMLENLEDGASDTDFVVWFQVFILEHIQAVLEHAARSALAPA
jgi:uncharacterized protein (DUF433 family)